MAGIFKILFKLKLRNSNQPLEDYLTEIFAYCLNNDEILTNEFLAYFGIVETELENINVSTQIELNALAEHKTDSRPDMAIFSETAVIFFENKVNAKEGVDQLSYYAEHLDKLLTENKKLVYITRDFDKKNANAILKKCKTLTEKDFVHVRWYNVFTFFKKYNKNLIISELLKFMKQNNLSMNNQFTPIDILTLTNFSNVRKIMDETLFGDVSGNFKKVNGKIAQASTCMTQLKSHDRYVYYATHNSRVTVLLGYWMNSKNEKEYPEIGIQVEISPNAKRNIEIREIFKKVIDEFDGWDAYSLSNITEWSAVFKKQSLQHIISNNDHIKIIKDYFIAIIQDLENIFRKYPMLMED